jgi:hypothetical protein
VRCWFFGVGVTQRVSAAQAKCRFDLRQNAPAGRFIASGAKQHAGAFVAAVGERCVVGKWHAAGEGKSRHQMLELGSCGQGFAIGQPGHGQQ